MARKPNLKPQTNAMAFAVCVAGVIGGISILLCCGCSPSPPQTSDSTSTVSSAPGLPPRINTAPSDGLDGKTLLQNLIQRYASATAYRDNGELLLAYKLEGRAIKEPHPFSITWEQPHRLSARIFKSHLQSDGKLLSCYVFDINTANLDQQQLFIPVEQHLPFSQLFDDSIVRHYLGGYADLPLDETEKTQLPKLIPAPLAMLTDELSFGWIQSPQAAQRLADQSLDQRPCYVVRSLFHDMSADVWIDQETGLLSQISMPLKIMDRLVLTAREIEDVELLMRFPNAQIDAPIGSAQPEQFSVALKPKATPIRRFLSVPDPFPSERIGQLVPKFELLKSNGQRVDHLYFDGKTAVLLWISNGELESLLPKFRQLIENKPTSENLEFGIVYSDLELDPSNPNGVKPNSEISATLQGLNASLFLDRQFQTSSKLQLRVKPAVVVINPNAKLEFVGTLSKDSWPEELDIVIDKVQRGVDVANEMKLAYQLFQESYQQQRITASAASLINLPASAIAETGISDSHLSSPLVNWKPIHAWSNNRLIKPGNILVDHARTPPGIFVIDGWRTVVEFDLSGSELKRFQLDIPDQGAVSCLRIASLPPATVPADWPCYAGFNVQSEKVYLFDRQWNLLTSLPPAEFSHDGIRDVVFQPRPAGKPLVVVALANSGGCIEFDCESRVMKQVFRSRADSIAQLKSEIFFANATQWGRLRAETETPPLGDDLMLQRLIAIDPQTYVERAGAGFLGVTAVDRDNNWYFGKLDAQGTFAWRQPVGSQLFNNEIEPLVGCLYRSGGRETALLAIADATNRITLVAEDGSFLGQFAAPANLAGLALIQHQGMLNMVLSTDQGVVCYRLTSGIPATPVSNPRNP